METGSHLLNRQRFPELRDTSLDWDAAGCLVNESIDLADFFGSEVLIEPNSTGFVASNQAGDKTTFLRIPAIDQSTQLATTNLALRRAN